MARLRGCRVTRERPVTQRGEGRVPAGWKRLLERVWCPACKRRRFVRRAVTLPVSGPADATWPELRAALHTAFGETTRCANWLVTQLYARDRQRDRTMRGCPRCAASISIPKRADSFLRSHHRHSPASNSRCKRAIAPSGLRSCGGMRSACRRIATPLHCRSPRACGRSIGTTSGGTFPSASAIDAGRFACDRDPACASSSMCCDRSPTVTWTLERRRSTRFTRIAAITAQAAQPIDG